MAARFGEMLLNRRRQMGLSIQQVANVIKIRPQIIEYFEASDFDAMPPRGYAQGMISSYARYLGLNPRQVVDVYFDELYEYERLGKRRGGRLEGPAGFVRSRSASDAQRRAFSEGAQSRPRFAQRPPQAGYVPESVSDHESIHLASDHAHRDQLAPSLPRSHEHVSRAQSPMSPTARRSEDSPTGSPGEERRIRLRSAPGDASRFERARPRGTQQIQQRGRGGTRGGSAIGSSQAQRRGNPPQQGGYRGARGGSSGGPGRGRRSGGSDGSTSPLTEARLVFGAGAVLLIVIIALAFLLLKGCAHREPSRSGAGSGAAATSPATQTDPDSAASSSASSDTPVEPQQPIVNVHVADGASSWIEVKLDGKYVYSGTAIGPFDQSYTVTASIDITVNTPGSVRVTKNGTEVKWSDKMAGVARMTITPPSAAPSSSPNGTSPTGGAQAAQ